MNYSSFYGIMYCCPVGERLSNCPMKVADHLDFKGRLTWFRLQNPSEKFRIIQHHLDCSCNRGRIHHFNFKSSDTIRLQSLR